jgi:hypothetical protein
MSLEHAEIGVVAHFRAWKRGDADLVTDAVQELTGHAAACRLTADYACIEAGV